MSNGLDPSKNNLRIYRGGDDQQSGQKPEHTPKPHAQPERVATPSSEPATKHHTDGLRHPSLDPREQRSLLLNEIATQFISSINFRDDVTRAVAPANTNLGLVVDALNTRWKELTGRPHLIGQGVLRELLIVSPVHLQNASGPHLVLEAALSKQATEGETFHKQQIALRRDQLGVASPAATAILMAAIIIKAHESLLEGRDQLTARTYYDHLTLTSFRTQAVDPMRGHSLTHHNVVVRYDFTKGIITNTRDPGDQSQNLWCAGSKETFSPRTGLWGWLRRS